MKNLIYSYALLVVFIMAASCNKGEAVIPSRDISAKDAPSIAITDTTNLPKHLPHLIH